MQKKKKNSTAVSMKGIIGIFICLGSCGAIQKYKLGLTPSPAATQCSQKVSYPETDQLNPAQLLRVTRLKANDSKHDITISRGLCEEKGLQNFIPLFFLKINTKTNFFQVCVGWCKQCKTSLLYLKTYMYECQHRLKLIQTVQ